MNDRPTQALVKAAEAEWEAKFEPNSFGFRPRRSCHDAINIWSNQARHRFFAPPKICYFKDLARHVSDGLPTLEELEVMDDESIIKTLTQVKGVGRWTVQMRQIFRLKPWNVLPVDDLGVCAGIRKLYRLEALPDLKTNVSDKGGRPYCSIVSRYLWRSLEPLPQPV